MEAACQKALEQIEEKDYEEEFLDDDSEVWYRLPQEKLHGADGAVTDS